ncbi:MULTISPECIES: MFS transporter [unclassified Nocardioides]|uniref:MFS transporter n=1 Tax=unclassified Nocardioides TaxID=2615069 RepID=UPI0006F3F0B2|nr:MULTISPECIES: MFS transporter [unclassified Nocardioides]KRA38058.1 MFS transporter [Nocardioides sp. Root614]KRA92018.1 MFS transporter [Nocardioides sp. Root682]
MVPPDQRRLARHRIAVAGAFATQGFVFIGLTTRLPDIKDRWDLTELSVSGVLLGIVLLAGAGSVLAEKLSASRSSASLLRAGLVLIAVGAGLMLASPIWLGYLAGVAVYGVGLGIVDATTNMQAVALEHRYGRPILPSFHGGWTFGGLLGAAATLATAHLDLSWAAVVAVVPLLMATGAFLPREATVAEDHADPAAATLDIPWRPILMVGLGMVVFYMVDTAAQTWGAVYVDEVLDAPSRWVALATLPYLFASLVVRLAGDRLVQQYGAPPVLRVGAVVACAGLAVVTFAPTWPIAVLGFTLVGTGISVVAPLSFSAAARLAGGSTERVDAVIARFNQFNYVGGLLGAVLTGVVGQDQLRFGFVVPMVLVLTLIPLARWFGSTERGEVSRAIPAGTPGTPPDGRSSPRPE